MPFSMLELIVVALLLALPFAYESSPKFRYYLKFSLYYGLVMTTAVFVIPIMMFRPGEVKNLLYVLDIKASALYIFILHFDVFFFTLPHVLSQIDFNVVVYFYFSLHVYYFYFFLYINNLPFYRTSSFYNKIIIKFILQVSILSMPAYL